MKVVFRECLYVLMKKHKEVIGVFKKIFNFAVFSLINNGVHGYS